MTDNAIEIRALTKRFGSFTAVNAIDLDVRRGEIFGFLGPNGSGKTTTIRMLCASIEPTGGTARILGHDVLLDPEAVRRSIGYMSQKFALFEDLTVDENLRFYAGVYALPAEVFAEKRRYVLEMADLVGREKELTANLSVGWKQRLALGCATIHEPELLFLDEPTSGVDPTARRQFWELLYELAERGVTLFVTTHYMDEASHCGRLAFIYDGRIIASGSPQEIRAEHSGDCIVEVEVDDLEGALAWLERAEGVGEAYLSGARLHASMTAAPADCAAVLSNRLRAAGFAVSRCERVEPTIEDVFVQLVSRQRASGLSHESTGAFPLPPEEPPAGAGPAATEPPPATEPQAAAEPQAASETAVMPAVAPPTIAATPETIAPPESQAPPAEIPPADASAALARSRERPRHAPRRDYAARTRLHEPARDTRTIADRPQALHRGAQLRVELKARRVELHLDPVEEGLRAGDARRERVHRLDELDDIGEVSIREHRREVARRGIGHGRRSGHLGDARRGRATARLQSPRAAASRSRRRAGSPGARSRGRT